MTALASIIWNIAIGWVWTAALGLAAEANRCPRWFARFGIAVGLSFGVSSVIYFVLVVAGIGSAPALAALEGVSLGAGVFLMLRGPARAAAAEPPWRWWDFALASALCVLLTLAAAVFVWKFEGWPHGMWDAWSIWNLRARYLAADGIWRYAVSPLLERSHPDYPLLTPALVARTWLYGGRNFDPAAPGAIAALFSFATTAFLTGWIWMRRGRTLALIADCVLLSCTAWVAAAGDQYADVPIALYFTGAIVLATAGGQCAVVAGVFARLAPLLALVLVFKLAIAPAADPLLSQGFGPAFAKIMDGTRWRLIFERLIGEVANLGQWYAHPLLLLAILMAVVRLKPEWRAESVPLWSALGLMLTAYLGVYLITPSDLAWHLGTSMGRLLIQLWPATVASMILALNPLPVAQSEPPQMELAGVRGRTRKKRRR